MIALSHPTGNANVRAVLNELYAADMLQSFHTSIATYPNTIWHQLGKINVFSDFKRRSFQPQLQPLTHTLPQKELVRLVANKMKWESLIAHETGPFCVDEVYRNLDRYMARTLPELQKNKELKAVYAYEDGALATFQQAKKMGLRCIYDLPIAYWETGRNLLLEEAERLPQWARTFSGAVKNSAEKLARKTEELALADIVVGPGSFVMDSLPDWAKDKKRIVSPFGSPMSNLSKGMPSKKTSRTERPLRVLFVGSMGQRKGLGDLFNAIKTLNTKSVELVVLGSLLAPMEFYKKEFPLFTYEATRSHSEVLELMQSCDIFCLPSIVEGRALVMQEAMSQGLPLIITPNTGGEDLIIEEETGFLVPIRSPEKIAEKINWFLEHRNQLPNMSNKAKRHAQKYTWQKYGQTIVSVLQNELQKSSI